MTKQYIISSFPSLHMTEMLTYFIIIRKTCFTNKGKTAKHGDSNITLAIITKLYFLRTFFSLGINKITLSLFSIFPQRLYLKMNFPWSHSEIWVLYLEKREKKSVEVCEFFPVQGFMRETHQSVWQIGLHSHILLPGIVFDIEAYRWDSSLLFKELNSI